MALLLFSLDNTVLDRTAALRAWGGWFLDDIGAPVADLDWLLNIDADGLTPRWDVAYALSDRYQLDTSPYALAEEVHEGVLRELRLEPLVATALRIARDAGHTPVVVTDGTVREVEDRIRWTGLDALLTDWVIAGDVGVSKPNPRIFTTAARRLGMSLDDAWIIGDSPECDISAAVSLGVRSIWVSRGREWPEPLYAPTRTADGVVAAIGSILGAQDPTRRSEFAAAAPSPASWR
ncbi:hypothetical protein GCM10010124_15860 [Pilimelia terevasa]|uniref:Uncharacterized protein n=1 Tax=Pilimelia terevasa TaxID=53372 RepID=A0A8J3BPK5_9ACTN|nr:HAD family hydrolase [Pilimelia terevasa]GGK24192.1 hypothetical protein GCM10010124_15860 [Pilimelia terevasa]